MSALLKMSSETPTPQGQSGSASLSTTGQRGNGAGTTSFSNSDDKPRSSSAYSFPGNALDVQVEILNTTPDEAWAENFQCAVCLDLAQDAVVTTCRHLFCRQCLVQWIDTRPTCPVCRAGISEDRLRPLIGRRGLEQEDPQGLGTEEGLRMSFGFDGFTFDPHNPSTFFLLLAVVFVHFVLFA